VTLCLHVYDFDDFSEQIVMIFIVHHVCLMMNIFTAYESRYDELNTCLLCKFESSSYHRLIACISVV